MLTSIVQHGVPETQRLLRDVDGRRQSQEEATYWSK